MPGAGSPRIDQGQDVGMLQVRGDPDFAQEALAAERRGEFGMQHLERDLPIVLEVVGEEDGGHAAPAELALDGVGAGEPILEDRAEVGQAGPFGKGGRAVLPKLPERWGGGEHPAQLDWACFHSTSSRGSAATGGCRGGRRCQWPRSGTAQ